MYVGYVLNCLSSTVCILTPFFLPFASHSLTLPPSNPFSPPPLSHLFTSLFLPTSDYIYVPAQSSYQVPEGAQREVSFILSNPPSDGVFEFDFSVTLSTMDGTATSMPD